MARPRKAKPPPPPPAPAPPRPAAPSVCEALLLATLCMVGLPVEAQVRDGSAYAGVLHTACVDGGYGIVLKKVRKIAKGKDDTNLALGAYVETLVVLSDDLVQVIAKDLSLPIKGVCRTLDCNVMAASGSLKPQTSHAKDQKMSKPGKFSPFKQVDKCDTDQEHDTSIKKNAQKNDNATSGSSPNVHMGSCFSKNGVSGSATAGPKVNGVSRSALAASMVASDVKNTQPTNNSATKVVMSSKPTAKESKLNPCAKLFSPSFASSRQVHPSAPPVNSNYISHSATEVPTGIPVFESNSVPGGPNLSSKVHYNNLPPSNYGISPQYVQSIMGHNAARLDPARVGTPYHPLQMGATYPSSSPQVVVPGKFNPVVYVHPVSQDAMHGTVSQGWWPAMPNSYQASLQKFQGNAPVYVAPPVMATGNLPLVVSSPAPLVQPFQAIRPIMIPAASSMVPAKYM
ncbi:hypothetical protein ACP4OV_025647 [Aristida adscensionis]